MRAESITKKQLIDELEKSKRRIKDLKKIVEDKTGFYEYISEHIVYQDKEMRILWANKAACDSVSLGLDDLVGQYCYAIWQGRKKPCKDCPVEKALRTGKKQEGEAVTPDGRVWLIRGNPVRNTKGKIIGAVEITLEITDRKHVEEELKESERRNRFIVNHSEEIILILNKRGQILFANKSALTSFGYSEREVIGKSITKFLTKDCVKKAMSSLAQEFLGRPQPELEIKAKTKSGQIRYLRIARGSTPIRENGKLIGLMACASDITERKRAEEILSEKEEKYSNLFHHSNDAIFIHDLKGNIIDVNQKVLNLFGYTKDEILSIKIPSLHPPEDLETSKKAFEKIARKGFVNFECQFKKKDGEVFPAEVSSSLFQVRGKKVIQGIVRDITKRKQTQKALRESEEKYRSAVENASDAIYIITLEGFEYVNTAFKKLTGYTAKEVCSKEFNFWNIIHPDDIQMIREREKARKKGEKLPSRYEFRIIAKSGDIKVVEPATVDIGEKGKTRVMGILRDITEQKKVREKIDASLKEKEVMLREIHHRVKNNMQIMLSLLRLQAVNIEDESIKEIFKRCQNRIKSMALIHEKLYQSKDLAKVDFSQYIQSLALHLFHSYGVDPHKIRMNTDVEDVHIDINQAIPFGLIINELISNSLKHAFPDGKKGQIRIKLGSDKNGKVKLVIRDNGVGLPKDFDFGKTETLGMQLVNDLVEQLNGSIKLENKGGTAYKIDFETVNP